MLRDAQKDTAIEETAMNARRQLSRWHTIAAKIAAVLIKALATNLILTSCSPFLGLKL